jgi:hypothetical protein
LEETDIVIRKMAFGVIVGAVVACGAAGAAFAAGTGSNVAGTDSDVATAALPVVNMPVVNMAAVEAAAQAEGRYGNQPGIGDDASTKLVQKALVAKGFRTSTDGWYGRGTTVAYAAYQRSLGYSGINANGLPGAGSLAKLGSGRFTIAHKVDVGSIRDSYRGVRVNTRTKQMLTSADRLVTWNITLSQGSYCGLQSNGCASASAGTHDGGGTIDVSVSGLSTTQRWRTVKALRTVGFAAWLRTPAQGFPYHIHAVAIGDPDLWQRDGAFTNRDQVADYYVGKNGLAGHGSDDTPTAYRAPFTWWEKYSKR